MGILEITGLTHSFGDGNLFKDARLALNKGEHMGVVGPNGAGKSTLVKICTGQVVPDTGSAIWQPNIVFGYLDQHALAGRETTVGQFLLSAFDNLYKAEQAMNELYSRAAGGDARSLALAAEYQEQLEAEDFYSVDTRVQQVAAGLGLLPLGLDRPTGELSGGQRAKMILAKLLLEQPDVLLLDEPTNFLDKEHISWLADYLSGFKNAFLVVSHDTAFLQKITSCICDIEGGRLYKYYGAYSDFLGKKAKLREDSLRRYAAQQREIKRTEEFIRRNIAGRKTRMAQGRRKQLERMERLGAPDRTEIRPVFRFSVKPCSAPEHLSATRLAVGYHHPIIADLSFCVQTGEKVVVTGFNGIGKSTLLKTLIGGIPALGGDFTYCQQAEIAYFEQDLVWNDPMLTPIQVVSQAYPAIANEEARRQLFRCGISSLHAMQPVGTLSGGEQAKVKLCLLTLSPCNFLILDEPTNHLDALAKEALQFALSGFPGTVLLVSHDEDFYRGWAQRVIVIEQRRRQ